MREMAEKSCLYGIIGIRIYPFLDGGLWCFANAYSIDK